MRRQFKHIEIKRVEGIAPPPYGANKGPNGCAVWWHRAITDKTIIWWSVVLTRSPIDDEILCVLDSFQSCREFLNSLCRSAALGESIRKWP